MDGRIRTWLPFLPWLLAMSALAWLEAQLWPDGGFSLLVIWIAVLLVYRAALAMVAGRARRVAADIAFAGICALAAFEGGWLLLPAVAAFAASDAAGLTLPELPDDPEGHELMAAFVGTLLGWAGLGLAAGGSPYATASSIAYSNGTVGNIPAQANLLEAGSAQTLALLSTIAVLFGLLTVAALAHVRLRLPGAGSALAAIALLLAALAVPALASIGLWPVPGVAFAVETVRRSRLVRPSSGSA